MSIKERIERGANQALFSYLPGQLVEYPQANAVVRVKNWASRPSDIPSKKRILDRIYKAAIQSSRYKGVDNLYPREPDVDSFYFGEPHDVRCELFPLVFTEEGTNRAYIFKKPASVSLFLKNWSGGRLMQRDLVFVSEDGEGDMDQLQPIVDRKKRPLKLEKYSASQGFGSSQAALRWVDATTGEVLGRVYGILRGKRVNEGTPARAKRTFIAQMISLVNIRDYIESEGREKELLGCLILAKYLYNLDEGMTLHEAFDKAKKGGGMDAAQTAKNILGEAGVKFEDLPSENRRKILSIASGGSDEVRAGISKIKATFSNEEVLNILDEVYEYLETSNSEGRRTLKGLLSSAESEAERLTYRRFISKLSDIGICSAIYIEDVPLVNLSYGFVRGKFETKETVLRAFPRDEFDRTEEKVPIYLTQMRTEGLLLGFDRVAILKFLKDRGSIKKMPEEGKEREWFLKNIDPSKITRFSGVLEESATKEVFNIIHTSSHVLMKQIPDQCGIGIDQIGEMLFPSIPAVLIFSREKGEFRLGALKDLFENKIYPWVDISFKASRPGSCVYDPVCFDGDGACHSCLFVNEISCGYFNQGLSRHVLFGDVREGTKGFWDESLKKF